MSSCLAEPELQELGNSMLAGFERRLASIPEELCAPFHEEARQLETELLTIHKMVALCTRKEEDLGRISGAWGFMVKMCDEAALRLHSLSQRHPYCGAETYYDRVLDLRNKCHRLQQMHS